LGYHLTSLRDSRLGARQASRAGSPVTKSLGSYAL